MNDSNTELPLQAPFFIGTAKLPNNILYAPLAGCSDFPFRQISCRYRPGIVYCEMVKIDALIRNDPHTYRLLDYSPDMHPIGAQLCGSKPYMAGEAAKIIEDLGFDVIDFNCGCPVDKVTKDGSGSGMLKNPELIGEVLARIVASVKIPVTVKIRAGWDEKSINAPLITQIAEKAGARAIAVHGRTREQAYRGSANWDYIRACKEVAKNILVIGNGDIFDVKAALKIFEDTRCDAILVSRGTMGQPWIGEDIVRYLSGQPPIERTISSIRSDLLEHLESIIAYQGERQSLLDFRRVGCWYLKRCIGAKSFRMELNRASSTTEIFSLLKRFSWNTLSLAQGLVVP
jgi:tRNA-dihydrouridine synthase B